MNIPGVITAGDSLTWRDSHAVNLTSGDSLTPGPWALHYAIRGPVALDLPATAAGGAWVTSATAAQTAQLTPGTYSWQAYCETADGLRVTVGYGDMTVKPNLAAATEPYDGRSLTKQILDAIEAEIKGRAAGGYTVEYSIAGRSLRKEPLSELLKLRNAYRAEYAQEIKRARMAQGRGDPTATFVAFRR